MAADGKIQALNNAIRETIPHLRDVASENPYAEMLVRCIAFSTGARWHLQTPTPVDVLGWNDLTPGGFTDLGAALKLAATELKVPPMPERALPPAMVLISDGQPTDDYEEELESLLAQPWGVRAVRLAVAIGRDADMEVLERFIARDDVQPLTANNPEQLAAMIRWASTVASRIASEPMNDPDNELAVPIPIAHNRHDNADLVW
jgi:uncharacterized protein YegL